MKNKAKFINDLISRFPNLKDKILESNDSFFDQMIEFKLITQLAVDQSKFSELRDYFMFVDENFDHLSPEIQNSLGISWLGKLDFTNNIEAKKLLPPRLLSEYDNLHRQYNDPAMNERIDDFLKDLGLKQKACMANPNKK